MPRYARRYLLKKALATGEVKNVPPEAVKATPPRAMPGRFVAPPRAVTPDPPPAARPSKTLRELADISRRQLARHRADLERRPLEDRRR